MVINYSILHLVVMLEFTAWKGNNKEKTHPVFLLSRNCELCLKNHSDLFRVACRYVNIAYTLRMGLGGRVF